MINTKLRILGISGSPRRAATDFAVKAALQYAIDHNNCEINYFSVRNKIINFCIHCDYCIRKRKGCIHKDDMMELYSLFEWANAIIFGTPVIRDKSADS